MSRRLGSIRDRDVTEFSRGKHRGRALQIGDGEDFFVLDREDARDLRDLLTRWLRQQDPRTDLWLPLDADSADGEGMMDMTHVLPLDRSACLVRSIWWDEEGSGVSVVYVPFSARHVARAALASRQAMYRCDVCGWRCTSQGEDWTGNNPEYDQSSPGPLCPVCRRPLRRVEEEPDPESEAEEAGA